MKKKILAIALTHLSWRQLSAHAEQKKRRHPRTVPLMQQRDPEKRLHYISPLRRL